MTSELREAAERLRRWRSGEDYRDVYGVEQTCGGLAERDCEKLIAAYLAEHPADDRERERTRPIRDGADGLALVDKAAFDRVMSENFRLRGLLRQAMNRSVHPGDLFAAIKRELEVSVV